VHRRVLACVAALTVAALAVLCLPAPVGASVAGGGSVPVAAQQPEDDPDGDPSTDDAPLPEQDMIPEPNSGRPPTDAGDRGGALQGLVFVLIVFGVGGIAVLAVRESRRARNRRATGSDRPAQVRSP
jgi:hypothetical protein